MYRPLPEKLRVVIAVKNLRDSNQSDVNTLKRQKFQEPRRSKNQDEANGKGRDLQQDCATSKGGRTAQEQRENKCVKRINLRIEGPSNKLLILYRKAQIIMAEC